MEVIVEQEEEGEGRRIEIINKRKRERMIEVK